MRCCCYHSRAAGSSKPQLPDIDIMYMLTLVLDQQPSEEEGEGLWTLPLHHMITVDDDSADSLKICFRNTTAGFNEMVGEKIQNLNVDCY